MLLAVAAVFLASSSQVATAQIAPASLQGDDVAQPVDVVVILDDSGSMATCWPWPQGQPPFFPPCASPSPNQPSDPLELRYSAARLLVQLADAEDRVAVIRFDTVAEGVGLMGDLQPVGDGDNRRRLVDSLQPPDDYFRRGYTRIDLGLQLAMDLLASARQTGRNQYILLLTDGEPTHPAGPDGIKADIAAQVDVLRSNGVLTFPVVLCNASAGCSGDFLRAVRRLRRQRSRQRRRSAAHFQRNRGPDEAGPLGHYRTGQRASTGYPRAARRAQYVIRHAARRPAEPCPG